MHQQVGYWSQFQYVAASMLVKPVKLRRFCEVDVKLSFSLWCKALLLISKYSFCYLLALVYITKVNCEEAWSPRLLLFNKVASIAAYVFVSLLCKNDWRAEAIWSPLIDFTLSNSLFWFLNDPKVRAIYPFYDMTVIQQMIRLIVWMKSFRYYLLYADILGGSICYYSISVFPSLYSHNNDGSTFLSFRTLSAMQRITILVYIEPDLRI